MRRIKSQNQTPAKNQFVHQRLGEYQWENAKLKCREVHKIKVQ